MAEFALVYEHLSDVELARLVTQRDPSVVREMTHRNNQSLYRASWSVLRDRGTARCKTPTSKRSTAKELRKKISETMILYFERKILRLS
jgi:hypothetical protein